MTTNDATANRSKRDSTYQGRTLAQWIRDVEDLDPDVHRTARHAVRYFGAEARPHLVALLMRQDTSASVAAFAAVELWNLSRTEVDGTDLSLRPDSIVEKARDVYRLVLPLAKRHNSIELYRVLQETGEIVAGADRRAWQRAQEQDAERAGTDSLQVAEAMLKAAEAGEKWSEPKVRASLNAVALLRRADREAPPLQWSTVTDVLRPALDSARLLLDTGGHGWRDPSWGRTLEAIQDAKTAVNHRWHTLQTAGRPDWDR